MRARHSRTRRCRYAQRLCLAHSKLRACVEVYTLMSLHREAVALACTLDIDLAIQQIDYVSEEDEDLRRKASRSAPPQPLWRRSLYGGAARRSALPPRMGRCADGP